MEEEIVTTDTRFWQKVNKNGPTLRPELGPCWVWIGGTNDRGYGQIKINRKTIKAHRYSYELHFGPIGKWFVCHKCDNPPCVNPSHLFSGDHQDNNDDKLAKYRDQLSCSSVNRQKTHCLRGHPLSGDNLYLRKDGSNGRRCKTCDSIRNAGYYRQK